MKKIIHMAKANILKHKSAVASLFVIIMAMSAITTVGLSVLLGVIPDHMAGLDRLNSLHSSMIMTKDMYLPSFEDIIRSDPRVSQYEICELLYPDRPTVNYGGEIDFNAMIFNLDKPWQISPPFIVEEDPGLPREQAIYLPVYAKGLGYMTGDAFTMVYKNRPYHFIVAGFFEASDSATSNGYGIRYYVPAECYEILREQFGSHVWIAVRFFDPHDSTAFNRDFVSQIDTEFSVMGGGSLIMSFDMMFTLAAVPIMSMSALILTFALIIAAISLMVVRFRVSTGIEGAMHEIGVLKASGYTSGQIIACYLAEYAAVALPAALLGTVAVIPLFAPIRQVLFTVSGTTWTLGANIPAGLMAALCITAILLVMVLLSCRRIKNLPPVDALRGGTASNSFRRNRFPLDRGAWSVQARLGLKNMFAYGKLYVMIGVIVTGISLSITFIVVMYQNFSGDMSAFVKMSGVEFSDVLLTVTQQADADSMAEELEKMPEVRKTSMYDWVSIRVGGTDVAGFASNDFDAMESTRAHDGRFPKYDNEIAMPKLLAAQLGKEIGDGVAVRANGMTQEFIITGFFSTTNNGGRVAAITGAGYRRFDPGYTRKSINVYFNEGVSYDAFSEKLTQSFGVLNVYRQDESGRFAEAKARAEEKISAYMEQYGINSIEYAVIYNGEIILSGSSGAYQVEKIENFQELIKTQIGIYAQTMALIAGVIAIVSLVIISLILSMTIRSIVVRRRRELGTLKACGFTTKQLARQLAISFIPAALVGVITGCVTGAYAVSPAMTVIMSFQGVHNAELEVHAPTVILLGAAIGLAVFVIANASAMRIKNISVYELLSE